MPTSHVEMCIVLLLLNLDLIERLTHALVLQFSYPFYACNACEDELVMMSKLLQMLERLEKWANWHRRSLIWMHGRKNTVWEEEGTRHRPPQLRRSNVSLQVCRLHANVRRFQITYLLKFVMANFWVHTFSSNRGTRSHTELFKACVNLEWSLPDWGELKNILHALCLKVVIENWELSDVMLNWQWQALTQSEATDQNSFWSDESCSIV